MKVNGIEEHELETGLFYIENFLYLIYLHFNVQHCSSDLL